MNSAEFKYLHVGFSGFVPTNEINSALVNLFNKATDWARYSDNNWILYTNQSPKQWLSYIQSVPALPAGYAVLIAPIDISQKWGLHQKWFWNWIEKPR
jgi:hypothetical protein